MRSPINAVVALAIAALVVAGCTPTAEPTSDPIPTASATPTPTPTVDPAAVQPFGGDCANALTIDEVNEVRPPSEFNGWPIDGGSAAVESAGALECIWSGEVGVFVSAVPATIAEEAGRPLTEISECTEGLAPCASSTVVDGLWLEVRTATESGASHDELLAISSTLLEIAAGRASAWPAAVPDTRADAWTSPDCSVVAASIDLAGLFGAFEPGIGRGADGMSTVEELLVDAGRSTYCEWSTAESPTTPATTWIEVTVTPRAGGLESTLVPRQVSLDPLTTTPFAVAGAVETGSWVVGSDFSGAIVSDGVNRVEVVLFGGAPADPVPLVSGLFAALATGG